MTPEKLKEVLAAYEKELDYVAPERLSPGDFDASTLSTESRAAHVRWMCGESQRFVDDGRVDRAMRWLGFIQGWLWMTGATLSELKRDSVPLELDSQPDIQALVAELLD